MSKIYYLSDFFDGDKLAGGAEYSDAAIREYLDIDLELLSYYDIEEIEEDSFYIVGNRSLVESKHLDALAKYQNYIIIEHDYQFITGPGNGRNPYVFQQAKVPEEYMGQLEFYENAKAVFFQTDFQKKLFDINEVKGNFISMSTTPYSKEEFSFFRELLSEELPPKTRKFAVVDSPKEIKNTRGAVTLCTNHFYDFDLLRPMGREQFLKKLSEYSALVFLPLTPESCSRLATEARILGLNVLTTQTYGACTESWFTLAGEELVDELERLTLEESIPAIKSYLPNE